MGDNHSATSADVVNVSIADITGVWEVIRINRKDDATPSYPWLNARFKFNFVDDMIFECLWHGQHSHGTWELFTKVFENKDRFSIILNGTFDFSIIDLDEDQMLLSDGPSKYFLVRKV
jgi:hypothetical protein